MSRTAASAPRQGEPQQLLSELLMSISLATDLGTGQPMGHALRACFLSVALAKEMGCSPGEVQTVFHVALLRFLGCTSDASESAAMSGGNEIAFNAAMAPVLMGSNREMMSGLIGAVAPGQSKSTRARLLLKAFTDVNGPQRALSSHCEAGAMLARRMGLAEDVIEALSHGYERWDGKGYPAQLRGDAIPLAVRIAIVARDADVFIRIGQDPAECLRQRAGHAYDPAAVEAFGRVGLAAIAEYEAGDGWQSVLDLEPEPVASVSGAGIERVLRVIADFVDLKSPWLRGHSPMVAELAEEAGATLGMDVEERRTLRHAGLVHDIGRVGVEERRTLRHAGLVHDIGRVGVENGIWDKAGPLSADEWERVRLHPYYSERILSRCSALAPLAELAACHHERLDRSGYHRSCGADDLSMPARILAAADVLAAACSDRPYRTAMSHADAAGVLEEEVSAGRLDSEAVSAVLAVVGMERREPHREWPAGLTDREVEVLRLIARGRTNKQVAGALSISPKTVGRHVENIYAKIDVSTRAGATLFAMENRLIG